jgi:serine/threonine-protein kinase
MGESMDGRADQYALAASAFHLLAGVPPFRDSNPAVVISKHLAAPPPRLATFRPELAHLDPALSRALAKNPAERYPRCLDFARALGERIAATAPHEDATRPEHTRPAWSAKPTAWDPAPPPASPKRSAMRAVTVIPILVLAVLLCGSAAFAVTQVLRPNPQPSTAAPQWQPYLDYAKQFAVSLTSLSARSVDSDIQRILDGSTGSFHDDFASKSADFRQTVIASNVTTQGTANSAGLSSISGTTAHVLVATTSKVTNNAGASQEPRSWRLDIQVEKLGDAYKTSKVEYVQ